MEKFGIDVSAWQGDFNFEKAKAEGVQFAILKCGGSDSGRYRDKKFERNYSKCKELGIPIGCYYFGADMTETNAIDSACHFANIICGKTFELPIYYDVEAKMLNLDKTTLTNVVNTFCSHIKPFADKVGVYASLDTFKNKLDNNSLGDISRWVACWGTNKPTSIKCDIWQFGGETNLIRSNKVADVVCDQNYSYFDEEIKPMEIAKPTLYKGCISDEVVNLQNNLNRILNSNLVVDGIYGDKTQSAVIDFQRKMFCTGIYDEATYDKMKGVFE